MALHRLSPLGSLLLLAALALTGTAGYTVQPGDTLSGIAQRLGVSVRALASVNDIADPDLVVTGSTLEVPAGGAASTGGGAEHVVVRGETLSGIARRHGLSTSGLAAANGIAVDDLIIEGQRLVLSAQAAIASAPRASAPRGSVSRAEVGVLLEQTAARYGLDPAFVQAVAWQESGWRQGVVSPDGAVGIMQVLPSTGRFVAASLVGRPLDLHDPVDNVEAGVAFLAHVRRLGGDDRTALAGYYQGLASLRAHGPYDDTGQYVDNILALRSRF